MPKFVAPHALSALAVSRPSDPAALHRWIAGLTMPWPWRRLLSAIRRRRRARQQRAELRLLEHRDLRDLGIDRSELPSFDAEAAGTAPSTRRRISRGGGAGHGSE
jgi:uncharacterized protein YjiS (DUF1127 family)